MPGREIDSPSSDGTQLVASLLARIDWLMAQIAGRDERIDELLAQLKTLNARIAELEAKRGGAPNESERALRPSVIFRKVTNGFRSEWGAKTYAALCSIVETGRRNGRSALTAIRDALALPAAQAANPRSAHAG